VFDYSPSLQMTLDKCIDCLFRRSSAHPPVFHSITPTLYTSETVPFHGSDYGSSHTPPDDTPQRPSPSTLPLVVHYNSLPYPVRINRTVNQISVSGTGHGLGFGRAHQTLLLVSMNSYLGTIRSWGIFSFWFSLYPSLSSSDRLLAQVTYSKVRPRT